MNVYLPTLFLILLCGMMDSRSKKQKCVNSRSIYEPESKIVGSPIARFCAVATLICVAGLRYKVGTDYGAYASGFPSYALTPWNLMIGISSEAGFKLLAKCIYLFSKDFAVFLFACAWLTIGLCSRTISKHSVNYWLSIVIYMMIAWTSSFNGIRQCMAIALLFAGHRAILNRNLLRWIIFVCIATTFHVSAIVMVVLYLVPSRKLSLWQIAALIVLVIFAGLSYEQVFLNLAALKGEERMVLNKYSTTSVNVLRLFFGWAPVAFYTINLRNRQLTAETRFYINMAIVNAVLMTVTRESALLFRICMYTNVYLVFVWPQMTQYLGKRKRNLAVAVIIFAYFIYFLFEIGIDARFNWIFQRVDTTYYITGAAGFK